MSLARIGREANQPVEQRSAARQITAIAREAWAMAWASPVVAVITILAVAAMSAGVLLTQGRAIGAREAIFASMDNAGSRTIVVRAEPSSGLTTSVLDRLEALKGLQWIGAFGPAEDVTAAPGGNNVPIRTVYTNSAGLPGTATPLPGQDAYGSPTALDQLGLIEGYGAVRTNEGADFGVVGQIDVPDHLRAFEPLLVVPQDPEGDEPVSLLVVVTTSAAQVAPLSNAIGSVLAVVDPTTVTIASSEQLALLQTDVDTQLGAYGASLVGGIFALTAALVAALMFGLVVLRRKDLGRRRALGASRELVLALLLTQVTHLGAIGAVSGGVLAVGVLIATNDPIAPVAYTLGVIVLAVMTAIVGGVAPAIVAARRDPLHELRVP